MKPVLLCLHGWGGSKESFTELREALNDADIEIFTPDLPGFGDEPEPTEPWTVDDYADWVENWLRQQLRALNYELRENHRSQLTAHSSQLFILGHSHGGRIALKLAQRGTLPISHLFLCASAGIRRPRHIKRLIGLVLAKTGAFFLRIPGLKLLQPLGKKLLYKLVRVHDYEQASPVMRATLINVTKEDLRSLLKNVRVPTDIFWGTDDRMTPVADARVMHATIAGSTLHLYPGVRHRVHRDKAPEIAAVIRQRLGRE